MSIDLVKGKQIKLKKTYSSNTIIPDNNDAIALFFTLVISTKHEFYDIDKDMWIVLCSRWWL